MVGLSVRKQYSHLRSFNSIVAEAALAGALLPDTASDAFFHASHRTKQHTESLLLVSHAARLVTDY